MVKNRLIACLLWKDGILVQSRNFRHTNAVGNAFVAVEFFNNWAIDEIVILNVTRGGPEKEKFVDSINEISKRCFVPLSVGGFIDSVKDIRLLLASGADKVVINTMAFRNNSLVTEGAKMFGSQCIVVSIDAKGDEVYVAQGSEATGLKPAAWAKRCEELGAGEIFLTSIEQDGQGKGYDLKLIGEVAEAVSIPVIASGGVGEWKHFVEGIKAGADAVSAANIFHYSDQSTKKAKNYMKEAGIDVREPVFYDIKTPRRPRYF